MTRTKQELRTEQGRVNMELRDDAVKLALGTKASLKRLEDSKDDQRALGTWGLLEFREFVRRELERGHVSATASIVNGARLLGFSQETVKRYMTRLCARGGPFICMRDVVVINPNYRMPDDDDYWQEVDPSVTTETITGKLAKHGPD